MPAEKGKDDLAEKLVTEDSGAEKKKVKKCFSFGSAAFFVVWFAYVQSATFVSMILDLMGFEVTHGLLSEHLMRLLRVKFRTTTKSKTVMDDTTQPVVFLSNHRSFADFIVDSAFLGSTCFVARRMICAGVPCCAMWGIARGWLWTFQRGVKHKEGTSNWFLKFLMDKRKVYSRKGVVIYPEGTRTHLPRGAPLKPGGLVAIHNLGWPVQIIITTNKELIMNESTFDLGMDVECVTSISETIHSKNYATADEFIEVVSKAWTLAWEDACGTDHVERARGLLPGTLNRHGLPG
jgi:1-acyl-sn-glycerol-3-phosphate acyltransferase